ncbi:MAG: hypothetical protein D5S00_05255 [Tindallia sp. MSAO_Bac2]|nr:MAG: hypothetical protein D5S00_05255 [Tindallia sp. MSAO_Bac2]
MKAKTVYKGHVIEFSRSLAELTLSLDGEVLDRRKGSLRNHKVDTTLEAVIERGNNQGSVIRAELNLGLFTDKVLFYFNSELIDQKKIL